MHLVVNHLPLKPGTDWTDLAARIEQLGSLARAQSADFRGIALMRASDTEAIILVQFTTREALGDISRRAAGPWFAENIRPYLAGPASRSVGELVAGALA
jgi:hypothetical protein